MSKELIYLAAWTILISIIFSKFTIDRRKRKDHVTVVNANEFANLKNKNQLVDVRDKEQFNKEHIVGARNIPLKSLNSAETKLFKNKPVYLYCNSGKTALKGASILLKQDFNEIVVMKDKLENYPSKKTK